MRELTQDPFFELIGSDYGRCVIDYCLVAPDAPYRGIRSHREAVLFAMLRHIERYLADQRESEEAWRPDGVAEDFFPWSIDFGKAKARPMDPAEFLLVPKVVRKIKGARRSTTARTPTSTPASRYRTGTPSWSRRNGSTPRPRTSSA